MRLGFLIFLGLAFAACQRSESKGKDSSREIWDQFSGSNALHHVQQLIDYGPRPPGSDAIERSRVYLTTNLEQFGWRVTPQSFTDETPRGRVTFVNLIATFPGKASPAFLLCSHYDTKVFDTARFVGANDGGSSNGVLLEMARLLAEQPELAAKVQLVFFDGEEAYVSFTKTDGLYGSRYFARRLAFEDKAKQFRGGILFDMVGDKQLTIALPMDSPAELAKGIFAAADALKRRQHFTYGASMLDDHTPINEVGIPMIDLIDFDYPPWHTPEDTMDKISAESLQIVGSVALRCLIETALK